MRITKNLTIRYARGDIPMLMVWWGKYLVLARRDKVLPHWRLLDPYGREYIARTFWGLLQDVREGKGDLSMWDEEAGIWTIADEED